MIKKTGHLVSFTKSYYKFQLVKANNFKNILIPFEKNFND